MSRLCVAGQHDNCSDPTCQCAHHVLRDGPVLPADGGRPGNLHRHQLIDRLNGAVEELDRLMAFLVTLAETQQMDPMRMQYPSGEPAMAPLVCAQAQVLAALAQLQAAP